LTLPRAYENEEWRALHNDLLTYSHDRHVFLPNVYRKGWEWTQTLYGLRQLGAIQPTSRALGVGAGREAVIFWLGDHISEVVATDLYGNEGWTKGGGREADAIVLENPHEVCPRPIRADRITFKTMNALDLRFADESFDFVWSLSSIEHFGSHSAAADAMREMARVVRPGGIVAVATELLLLDEYNHDEYFTRPQFDQYVVNASDRLALIEPIDWTLPPVEYLIDSIVLPEGVHRRRRHVVLNDGSVQWTSILIFLRKR
jgi:SAM-dependent methyltransferase